MNQAYCMDCMEALRQMPDKCFDLAIVDPPYGLPKGSSVGAGKLKSRALNRGNISTWDTPPSAEYFSELFRVSKNQIIWGGNYFGLPPCRCFVVWDKLQPWENFSRCEYAWTSFNKPSKLFAYSNRRGGQKSTLHKSRSRYTPICLTSFQRPGTEYLIRTSAADPAA